MSTHQDSAVEAVARAIKAVWDTQQALEAQQPDSCFDYEPGPWEEWEPEARAAIAAMPTDTTLREQRDELLEALEKFAAIEMGSDADCQVEIVPNGYSDPMMWRQHIDAARSAIAKARGAS